MFGLIVVTTSEEQLAGCIICARKVLHLMRLLTHLSINSIWRWDQSCSTSPTVISHIYSGCRPVYELMMVAWGWDVCLRCHVFLPFWLQERALSLQDDILSGCSCSDSVFFAVILDGLVDCFGASPDTLTPKQPNNRFGTVQVSWQTKLGWSPAWARSWGWLLFWQPHHHILGIGFSPCPYHHVVWDSTTKQYESESLCGLVWPFVSHCGASVDALGLHGFFFYKKALPPGYQPGITPWMTWLPGP